MGKNIIPVLILLLACLGLGMVISLTGCAGQGVDRKTEKPVDPAKVEEVKKRIELSETFLKEFPDIYEDLVRFDTADKFNFLMRITLNAWEVDGTYKYETKITNQDIAYLIGEVLLESNGRLTKSQKYDILDVSGCLSVYNSSATSAYLTHWFRHIPESIPYIMKLLKDKDAFVREHTIYALGWLRAKEAVPEITKFLQDKNTNTRISAVHSLGQIGAKEVIPELKKRLQDEDVLVRNAVQKVLEEWGVEIPKEENKDK